MTRRARVLLKAAVWAACLAPLAGLLYRAATGNLSANPISFITNWLGDWTLRLLLTCLAMTPLRLVSGWSWPVTLRRLLGLFTFFYATLHFSVWLVLDHFFNWREMGADILKRPYITVGLYGQVLPNQNGAPVRVVVPWKYGFKSAKSIVRIRFVSDQPRTAWEKAQASEYGFYSNVNPAVDHPRWSQATERRIGEFRRRPTPPFNGYADQVAQLYAGMDLKKYY